MTDLVPSVGAFLQVLGMVAVVALGYVKFKATTDAAIVSISKDQQDSIVAITAFAKEVKELTAVVGELKTELACMRVERDGANARLERLESVVFDQK